LSAYHGRRRVGSAVLPIHHLEFQYQYGMDLSVLLNRQNPIGLEELHTYSVKITGTNSARLDLDIDIIVFKGFWGQFVLVEFCPMLWVFNLEASEGVWINHLVIEK